MRHPCMRSRREDKGQAALGQSSLDREMLCLDDDGDDDTLKCSHIFKLFFLFFLTLVPVIRFF